MHFLSQFGVAAPSFILERCLQLVQLAQVFVVANPVVLRLLGVHAFEPLLHILRIVPVLRSRPFDIARVVFPAVVRERRHQRVQPSNVRVAAVAAVHLLLATHGVQDIRHQVGILLVHFLSQFGVAAPSVVREYHCQLVPLLARGQPNQIFRCSWRAALGTSEAVLKHKGQKGGGAKCTAQSESNGTEERQSVPQE